MWLNGLACLHATHVPRFIFPFASVFCVMKDFFQAWAGPFVYLLIEGEVQGNILKERSCFALWSREFFWEVDSYFFGIWGILVLILLGCCCCCHSFFLVSSVQVHRDSNELSVLSVWYSSSSLVSSSGVGGLNLFLGVILSVLVLVVLVCVSWFIHQCYSVCWHLVTRVLKVFHFLAQFCSGRWHNGSIWSVQFFGSCSRFWVWEGIGTVRGRWSDELDFLLRQVEQAFTPRSSLRTKL